MAVLTNKPVRFSQAILDGLGIANHFQFVFGGNSFEKKKPDPMGVELLLGISRRKPDGRNDGGGFRRGRAHRTKFGPLFVRRVLRPRV